jgi:HlyD family secretion protein
MRGYFMTRKMGMLALILIGILAVVSLVACSRAQSSTPPAGASPSPNGPASANGGPPPGGAPGGPPVAQSTLNVPVIPAKLVSGAGTVEVATDANLYFGTAGQIITLNAKEGDRVTKGTVLAKLDTAGLEASLALARVALNQARLNQLQANSNLATAQFNLDKVQAVSDVKDAITNDEWTIKVAEVNRKQALLTGDSDGSSALNKYIADIQKELIKHKDQLSDLLSGDEYKGSKALNYDINGQTYDRLTVEDAHLKQLAVEMAQQTLDQSQDSINLAQKNLDLIVKQLDQATITAPFDCQIARVNQSAGDYVAAPSQSQHPIFYIIDPASLQLVIGVNELDMPKIKVGQKSTVSIDAFPAAKLNGQVAAISPLPTLQGLIVEYEVTIDFDVPSDITVRTGMNAAAAIASE